MPNSRQLAMRDPALAALVGAIAGSTFGSDFGADEFGDEFGDDFGDDFGDEFGDEFAADDFGAAAAGTRRPTPAAALTAWRKDQRRKGIAIQHMKRARMLDPNRGSSLKIEGYVLTLSEPQAIGAAAAAPVALSTNSSVTMRPQRMASNVPVPGLATYSSIQVSNVDAIVGTGVVDAFTFYAGGVGVSMSLPTVSPADQVKIKGTWNAFTPAGYNPLPFTHTVAFFGPAKMTGS